MNDLEWLGLIVVLLAHTAAIFRWSGRIDAVLKALSNDVIGLRKSRHDQGESIAVHEKQLAHLEDDVGTLRDTITRRVSERREHGREE